MQETHKPGARTVKKDLVQRTKTGRRTKLTPEVQQTIATAIAAGVPFEAACQLAGVSANVAAEWRRRGEGTDPDRPCTPLYATFATALAHARARCRPPGGPHRPGRRGGPGALRHDHHLPEWARRAGRALCCARLAG